MYTITRRFHVRKITRNCYHIVKGMDRKMAKSELMKGNAAMLILRIIDIAPSHGYEIIKELDKRSDGAFRMKEGTLYPILHTLEQNGLVHSKWEDTDKKRRRKYYFITPAGKKDLDRRLEEWTEFSRSVNAVMKKAILLQI